MLLTRKTWKWVGISGASLAGVGAGLFAFGYVSLNGKVQSEDVNAYLTNRPTTVQETPEPEDTIDTTDQYAGKALTYLLIGSDSREGENASVVNDGTEGSRSDTTIIMHIAADRSWVDAVSIPRDSIVDIPSCMLSDGSTTTPKTNAMFNSAFSEGDTLATSVACTIATVEKNTGVYIDGYAVADFSGFEDMVDAIGGITMDIPEDMKSKKSGLDVQKGTQTLDGEQALAYARARTFEVGSGNGSDIQRVERQQELLSALSSKVISAGTLANPLRLYNFLDSSLNNLTVSPDLGSLNRMVGLGFSLRNIDSDNVNFYTIPWESWSQNRNRIIWTDEADAYWESMIDDTPIMTEESLAEEGAASESGNTNQNS